MSRVSIVIPARDAADVIGQQLAALASEAGPDVEVIVADNGSRDRTSAIVRSFSNRLQVRVVDASTARGAAGARNVGAQAASGDTLLFIDADDIVQPGWFAAMAPAAAAAPVGGPILYVDRDSSAPLEARIAGRRWPDGLPKHEGVATFQPSCNLGVPRRVFELLGGFDERFARAEDIDFGIRLAAAGHPLQFVPGGRLVTMRRRSVRGAARQFFDYGRYEPLLRRTHRSVFAHMPVRNRLRRWGRVGLLLPRLHRADDRYAWLTNAALCAGRVVGWVQLRTGRLV